jgi:hypothetical protein
VVGNDFEAGGFELGFSVGGDAVVGKNSDDLRVVFFGG